MAKPTELLDCAMCDAPDSFVISPLDPSVGYCFAEERAWRTSVKRSEAKSRHREPLTDQELDEIRNVVVDRYQYSVSERFRIIDAIHDIKRLVATIDKLRSERK